MKDGKCCGYLETHGGVGRLGKRRRRPRGSASASARRPDPLEGAQPLEGARGCAGEEVAKWGRVRPAVRGGARVRRRPPVEVRGGRPPVEVCRGHPPVETLGRRAGVERSRRARKP